MWTGLLRVDLKNKQNFYNLFIFFILYTFYTFHKVYSVFKKQVIKYSHTVLYKISRNKDIFTVY